MYSYIGYCTQNIIIIQLFKETRNDLGQFLITQGFTVGQLRMA